MFVLLYIEQKESNDYYQLYGKLEDISLSWEIVSPVEAAPETDVAHTTNVDLGEISGPIMDYH